MKHAIHAFSVCALMATVAAAADECRDPKLRDEILKMCDEDQNARPTSLGHIQSPAEVAEMVRVDAIHAKRVSEIVKEVGWPTISPVGTNAARAMSTLVLHFDLADQDQYLPLMEKAVAQKEAVGGWVQTAAGPAKTETTDLYHPVTGAWALTGSMSTVRTSHAITLLLIVCIALCLFMLSVGSVQSHEILWSGLLRLAFAGAALASGIYEFVRREKPTG